MENKVKNHKVTEVKLDWTCYWKKSWEIILKGETDWIEKERREWKRKNMKETFKHEKFTKYARTMTKSHLIASISSAGKVGRSTMSDCCDFWGCLIDGMIKWAKKGEGCNCSEDFAITELEFCWLSKKFWRLVLWCLDHGVESFIPWRNW